MNDHLRPRNLTYVCITLVALLWFGALAVRATDRYVVEPGTPGGTNAGNYTDWTIAATQIQWAVDKAAVGETVWVTNGTYHLTNQISISTAITVTSVNGRTVTIVDGNYPTYTNRCFYITAGAVLDGFTIFNGFANSNSISSAYGGGVCVSANGAYVQNCTITGNKAFYSTNIGAGGGGIYANKLSYVLNCTISSNTADTQLNGYGGGGIYIDATGGVIVSNCVIFTNTAWSSTLPAANAATLYGGGVLMNSGLVVNCAIYNNSCQHGGGGANVGGGILRNCVVSNNYVPDSGSGIYITGSPLVEGCLIIGNNGGLSVVRNYSSGTVRNCTIVNNYGAGTHTYYTVGNPKFENIISYNNNGSSDTSGTLTTTNVTYSNCCSLTGLVLTNLGPGNITNNPLFVNSAGGNYRLNTGSPCINAGVNRDWMTNAVDLDGRTRIQYGTVDMGAYERIHNATFCRFH